MLRRKLMLMLGLLVALLAIVSIVALWLLQGVLRDLKRIDTPAWALVEHQAVIDKFRWVLLGLGLAFLVLVNAAAVVLIRAAVIVLRPVDQLIEASRMLAHDRFEYRVQIDAHNEFSELAQAFNALAERLQENEKRRVEVLAQAALTLNHELNNAMAVIELRLHPLARQACGNAGMEKCLREIRENLGRMARTVEAIKHIRRIVLTDYVTGVKMLDLERSMQPADA